MSAIFTADEIISAATGTVVHGRPGSGAGRLVWRLDEIEDGDWFLAGPSGSVDTHDQLSVAFKLGARGCIVNRRNRYSFTNGVGALISVADTNLALLELVRYWRNKVNPTVIAVVGSVGRSQIVYALELLLKDAYRCHKALEHDASGCIPDVLEMPGETELLIAEVGGTERGDIARIGNCLSPDVAVIGKVQHPLPSFKRDAKAAALHCEIIDTIQDVKGGCAIIYDQNPAVKDRARRMLHGLGSISYSQTPEIPDDSLRSWLSERFSQDNGRCPTEVDLWCAIKGAQALGFELARKEEFINLS